MDSATFLLSNDDDLICMDCDRPLPPGAPIGERLDSVASDSTPIVELTCVYCAMGLS